METIRPMVEEVSCSLMKILNVKWHRRRQCIRGESLVICISYSGKRIAPSVKISCTLTIQVIFECASWYSTVLTIRPLLIRCNQLLFREHGVLEEDILLFQAIGQVLHELVLPLQAIELVDRLVLLL